LYSTLHRYGYASASTAVARDDGLRLTDCRINNAVKCLPPQNKPTPDEARRCNAWLAADIATLPPGSAILALGLIAHDAVLRALDIKRGAFKFAHQARHALPNATLFDSYHCSRYNTNTRRLTTDMFHAVFTDIAAYLGRPQPA
jgi:uracil-DNA glycosylase family 4